jgi:hypothetical protein
VSTTGASIRVIAALNDSIEWFSSTLPWTWQLGSTASPFTWITAERGPGAFELRLDIPDSIAHEHHTDLVVAIPADLAELQIDAADGSVAVQRFAGGLTITMKKGRVSVFQATGPTLIENRDGQVWISLGTSQSDPAFVLRSPVNVLARNGNVQLAFPADTKATIDAEAHRGQVLDAWASLTTSKTGGFDVANIDGVPSRANYFTPPRDSASRTEHRVLNGGGPQIKLVALNGNVTLTGQLPGTPPGRDAHAPYTDGAPKPFRK